MPFYEVTTNNPNAAPTYDPSLIYEAVDETDAIAQMVKKSNIRPDQCSGHRFRAVVVNSEEAQKALDDDAKEKADQQKKNDEAVAKEQASAKSKAK